MARHETEMHRQRRELLDALRPLAHLCETLNSRQHAGMTITPAMWSMLYQLTNAAKATIQACSPPCDVGLFGDNRQMDLADRKDVP